MDSNTRFSSISTPRGRRTLFLALVLLAASTAGCGGCNDDGGSASKSSEEAAEAAKHRDSRPAPMSEPVPLWENGKKVRTIDAATAAEQGYALVDLSDFWTPYIFTERGNENEPIVPNAYRETYLALARGEYPDDHHGERAQRDKYLELYGIPPTLSLLRERFRATQKLGCIDKVDLKPFTEFDGFVSYQGNDRARRRSRRFPVLEREVKELVRKYKVPSAEALDEATMRDRDTRLYREYKRLLPEHRVVSAAQERLRCAGYLEGKGSITPGALDWATHEALAEFERRHRVYGWGFIGRETLKKLQRPPLDLEREAVVRVLTERAMHAAGVIEDGSTSKKRDGSPVTFVGKDGKQHRIPNLEKQLRDHLIAAFGLKTTEGTWAWLKGLGPLGKKRTRWAAFKGPTYPEYYDGDMELSVVINRGDVWYEFPYDEEGNKKGQPVSRRPRITIFTEYNGKRIALARFGTTIGGWKTELIDGTVMLKYKNSPPGPRVWKRISAAPVWIPPESTPPRDLLKRKAGGQGKDRYYVNYHEVGPSYASAYGLVAAYHLKYYQGADGEMRYGGDEGIRTHGSVDYMSIMRRHSHGCHRLHNHIAVRLMSFVLAHRPHKRIGQQKVTIQRTLPYKDFVYTMAIKHGGYDFDLERPVPVNVLEGRIRGRVKAPIPKAIPRYNEEVGAYIMPEGGAVAIDFAGRMREVPLPVPEGGAMTFDPFLQPQLSPDQIQEQQRMPTGVKPGAPTP